MQKGRRERRQPAEKKDGLDEKAFQKPLHRATDARQGSYVTLQRCGQLLLTARAAAALSSHLCAHVSRHQAVARGHDPTTTRTSGHISPNKGPEAWVLVGPDEAHNGQDAVQRCTKDKLRTGGKNKERELQKHVISRHGKGRVPGAWCGGESCLRKEQWVGVGERYRREDTDGIAHSRQRRAHEAPTAARLGLEVAHDCVWSEQTDGMRSVSAECVHREHGRADGRH